MQSKLTLGLALTFAVTASLPSISQTPPRRGPGRGAGTPAAGGAPNAVPMGSMQQVTLKPYADVVTKEAKSQVGVFGVHRVGTKVLWEIPADKLGRMFLWQTEVAQVPTGTGYPGVSAGSHLLYFERHDNSIYMREKNFSMRSEAKDGLDLGVNMASIAPILSSFAMEAEGKDKSAVIDVTRLFTTDQAPFSVAGSVGSSGVDLSRSFVEKVSAFPINIETRSWLTFGAPAAKTALVHYSLCELPDKPMMPRYRDDRVGFFGTNFTVYGRPDEKAVDQTYIDRFRLEKKDPSADMSEPVKPIVFYLAREVPDKYRPALKRGVENWAAVFEKAGFKNAIICKNAPSAAEDPTWDSEDARYSVIRWAPSTTANAMGPHVADPRSGETISAHIIVWHNVLNLVQQWYFSQASQLDAGARHIPFADDLMTRLVEYVVCHEVGHTLGLEHNFKASTAWSVEQLRTKGFVSTHGVASSIMSYSRFNYVAQPSDNLPREDLMGRIGAYDVFAIKWGYTPIPGVHSADEEKSVLDAWALQQIDHPELQFGNYAHQEDPTTQSECIGSDPVRSSELGLQNIERVATYLASSTFRLGDNYDRLRDYYNTLSGQRSTEINRVARFVGGTVEKNWHTGHGGIVFTPVPKADQKAAVQFLVKYGMHPSVALMEPSITHKIFASGDMSRVVGRQTGLVASLLSEQRVQRLLDFEAQAGRNAYTVSELASDVQNGVWSELTAPHASVDVYRRVLQMSYLATIDQRINGTTATKSDLNGIARENLRTLAHSIDKALPHVADEATARHLRESRRVIGQIMEGKYVQPVAADAAAGGAFGIDNDADPMGCGPKAGG